LLQPHSVAVLVLLLPATKHTVHAAGHIYEH
jgi:hypothetical protein